MNVKLINYVVENDIASKEEAEEEYNKFVAEAKKQFSHLPEEEQKNRTDKMFVAYFTGIKESGLKTVEGIILKCSGKNFITKRRIEKMMRQYNENPEECLWKENLQPGETQGFVGKDGKISCIKIIKDQPVAVDPLQYWNEGKPNQRVNPNYGNPLDENNVEITYEGVFMFGEEDKQEEKKFNLKMRGDFVYSVKVPLGKPLSMKVVIGESIDEDTIRLEPRRGTKFEIIKDRKADVMLLIEKYYGDKNIAINQIEEELGKREPTDYNFTRMLQGQVMDLNLAPKADGSGGFRLMQESTDFENVSDCRVKVPEEWLKEIDFGEFSTVKVLGSPWVIIPKEEGRNKVIGITAEGIYPIEVMKPIEKTNGIKESDVNGNGEIPKVAEEFKEFNKIEDKIFEEGSDIPSEK